MLIRPVEEQVIAPDRAAERDAPALVRLDRCHGAPAGMIAAKVAVRELVESAAVETVRAGLGHDVDGAARKLAIFNVERGELDLRLADRIIGNGGRAARREAGVV